MSMRTVFIRKLASFCLSVLAVTTLTFLLMKALPGDPFQQEQALPTEIYQALRAHYGLNDPLSMQYLRYLGQLLSFDFGPSLIDKGESVNRIIQENFPVSAYLGLAALLLAVPAGLLIGIFAAVNHLKWQDSLVTFIAVAGISVPSFVIATALQYLLAIKLGWLPIARWGSFKHIILPALSLAALPTAFLARMTRTKMAEEMKMGYIVTARAKGLSECRILFFHALHNILVPILSYLGPLTASILTGSFIIEKIYGIPGLGNYFVQSVSNRDYPVIMGVATFYCILLLFWTFLVDLAVLYLDPRLAAPKEKE